MAESIKVGGTVMWANFREPNEMSGRYQFDLCNLSPAACKALEGLGIDIKNRENRPEKGNFITMKSTRPIRAYDSEGKIIEEDVGNGSKAQVVVGYYDWVGKGKKGRSPSCVKIVVTDLQVYGGANEEDVDEDMVL